MLKVGNGLFLHLCHSGLAFMFYFCGTDRAQIINHIRVMARCHPRYEEAAKDGGDGVIS